MRNLCDVIEQYLKELLDESGTLELQRGEIAERFACVPSQINYVLETRFSVDRGYVVESRRGGGGYIRIVRLPWDEESGWSRAVAVLGDSASQEQATNVILGLAELGVTSERETVLLLAAIDRETLALPLPHRDEVRARVLRAMILALARAATARGNGPDAT